MKNINGLDLALSVTLFFGLLGLASAQCAGCGAERNASERGQGKQSDSSGHSGDNGDRHGSGSERNGDNQGHDHNDSDRDRTATFSHDAPTPSARSERRNEMGYRMIEQMASNPDFGNIEPGDAARAQALGNHVKEAYDNWDSDKSVLENVSEAVGIKNETREIIDHPKDVPYHNEDRIVLP